MSSLEEGFLRSKVANSNSVTERVPTGGELMKARIIQLVDQGDFSKELFSDEMLTAAQKGTPPDYEENSVEAHTYFNLCNLRDELMVPSPDKIRVGILMDTLKVLSQRYVKTHSNS